MVKVTLCLLCPASPEQDGIHGSDEFLRLDCPDGGEDLLNPRVAPKEPERGLLAGAEGGGDPSLEVSGPVTVSPGGGVRPGILTLQLQLQLCHFVM